MFSLLAVANQWWHCEPWGIIRTDAITGRWEPLPIEIDDDVAIEVLKGQYHVTAFATCSQTRPPKDSQSLVIR